MQDECIDTLLVQYIIISPLPWLIVQLLFYK